MGHCNGMCVFVFERGIVCDGGHDGGGWGKLDVSHTVAATECGEQGVTGD